MQTIVPGLKSHTHMILDTFVGGTMKIMTTGEVREQIGNMFLNEYHSRSNDGTI